VCFRHILFKHSSYKSKNTVCYMKVRSWYSGSVCPQLTLLFQNVLSMPSSVTQRIRTRQFCTVRLKAPVPIFSVTACFVVCEVIRTISIAVSCNKAAHEIISRADVKRVRWPSPSYFKSTEAVVRNYSIMKMNL
jgi:hypothetical protein